MCLISWKQVIPLLRLEGDKEIAGNFFVSLNNACAKKVLKKITNRKVLQEDQKSFKPDVSAEGNVPPKMKVWQKFT